MRFLFWKYLHTNNKFDELERDWSLKPDASTNDKISTLCCISTSALFILFYFPFLSYHFRKYYQQRHHIVFQKRRNRITNWEISIFLFKLIYGAIMYNAYLIFDATSLTFNILLCIDDCLLMTLLYLFVWRFYILFYDINWTVNVLDNEWMVLLNSTSTQQNWYLMNKKTYGSAKWIFIRYIFPSILISNILCTVNVVLGQIFSDNITAWGIIQLWGATIEIVPYIILIIIFCKSKDNKFDDQFFILQELKYIFIALTVDNISNVLLFVGVSFLWQYDIFYRIILPCFGYNFIWGSQFIACLISTKWVNAKVESIVKYNQYQIVRKRLSFGIDDSVSSVQFLQVNRGGNANFLNNSGDHQSTTITPSTSGFSAGYTSSKNKELFFKLLSKQQGFHAFMLHLTQEFSIETLLYLIEVIQFQNYIKSHCKYDLISDNPGVSLYEKILFPAEIPKSEIVYADDYKMEGIGDEEFSANCSQNEEDILLYSLKVKAIKIYNKYIKPQAELEINISYHGRRQLTKLMGHDEIIKVWLKNNINPEIQFKELLDLYDEACNQIFALIIDSFNRFKHTNKYSQLKQFKIFV